MMLQRISHLPEGVDGLSAIGTVTGEDHEQLSRALFREARRDGRQVRLLYHFGPEFERLTAGGVLADARIGLRYLRLLERCAVVSDRAAVRDAARLVGAVLPCQVRVFEGDQWSMAVDWLKAPVAPHVRHRLIRESGVLVVQPTEPLCPDDFDAIALTVDPWIEAHGELQGLVIHLQTFPGWEDFGAFVRHVQFVREHHLQVRRVALVADGRLAHLIPKLGDHFVNAELKHFRYSEVSMAIAWAGRAEVEPTSSRMSNPLKG